MSTPLLPSTPEALRTLAEASLPSTSPLREASPYLLQEAFLLLSPFEDRSRTLPEVLQVRYTYGEAPLLLAEAMWRGLMHLEAVEARSDNLLRSGTPFQRRQVQALALWGQAVDLHPTIWGWDDEAFTRAHAPTGDPSAHVPSLVAAFSLAPETWRITYGGNEDSSQEGLTAVLVFDDGASRRYRLPATTETLLKVLEGLPPEAPSSPPALPTFSSRSSRARLS